MIGPGRLVPGQIDYTRLPMWVVYDHPVDIPECYVARMHYSLPAPEPTAWCLTSEHIEPLRKLLQAMGAVKFSRNDGDDPVILETWML